MLMSKLADLRAAKGNSGFTLIELLVVVVILVALAAIAIPVFLNQQAKANDAAATSSVANAAAFVAQGIADGSLVATTDPMTSATGSMAKNGVTVTADVATGTFCVHKGGFEYSNLTGAVVEGTCS